MLSRPDGYHYVVIKVLSVPATYAECDELCYEAAVATSMARFQTSDTTHPGFRHCAMIRSRFIEDSAHGEHLCVVLTPYGTSLRDILETSPTSRFPLRAVKRVTRQVLLGLSFLEFKLQRVHPGESIPSVVYHIRSRTSQMSSWRTFSSIWEPAPNKLTAFLRTTPRRFMRTGPRSTRAYRHILYRPYGLSLSPTLV